MNTPNDKQYAIVIEALAEAHDDLAELIDKQDSGPVERDILGAARHALETAQSHIDGAKTINRYAWDDAVRASLRRVEEGETTADDAAILWRAIK